MSIKRQHKLALLTLNRAVIVRRIIRLRVASRCLIAPFTRAKADLIQSCQTYSSLIIRINLMHSTHKSLHSLVSLIGACVFLLLMISPAISAAPTSFDELALKLNTKSFKDKAKVLTQLAVSGDERTQTLFEALLRKRLYFEKSSGTLLYVTKNKKGLAAIEVLSGQDRGLLEKKTVKKISTNNRLRKQLKNLIAGLSLSHPEKAIRLASVKQMLSSANADSAAAIAMVVEAEQDAGVRELMQLVLDLNDLQSQNPQKQLAAINSVSDRLEPQVRNRLTALLDHDDTEIAAAADQALQKIQARVKIFQNLKTVFFGLSLGSVLVLAAIGLAITFGVMGVINMAHGELIMLGAYTTYALQQLMPNFVGASLLLSIPLAFLVSALVGILIERLVIRHLYGRPLETLLATFGISLILQQAVRSIFSPLNRSVESPSWLSGSWEINSVLSLTYNRLYIIAFCLLVFLILLLVMKKTTLGLNVRAVSQNRSMARAMGIRADRVDILTFGLGSGVAGVAGVALSQITNVGPNLGQAYIIDSFMVVVFGGVGNLWGTLISGFTLGVANKFMEPWAGAVMAKILVLVFIILFIQKRPRGLFPQKGRAAEG